MTTKISVVIPTYNSASTIISCLESIKSQTHASNEVIVCDGGSTDSTVSIARAFGATVICSKANRSSQRNIGASHAKGDLVLFVDSDMRLRPRVLEACVNGFSQGAAALVIPERDIGMSFWARAKGFERSLYSSAWWLKAARCFRLTQFLEIGGFDTELIATEDWDLDERIRQIGDVVEVKGVDAAEHNVGYLLARGKSKI